MEIVHIAPRKRKDHGKHCDFLEKEPELIINVEPSELQLESYVELNPISRGSQCVPEMSDSDEAFTERIVLQNQGMAHLEGGWPKDIDPTEADQKLRYCKNLQNRLRQEHIQQFTRAAEVAVRCVQENNAVDIYEPYFDGVDVDHSSEPPNAKTLTVFRDPTEFKRTMAHISWLPTDGSKLATACCVLQFQQMPENVCMDSYIWDITNPNFPQMTITPPSPLLCLEYSTKDPHFLVGGSYNGLVSYWDTRKSNMPAETSSIDTSHRDPVYDVKWLQSKSGFECLSVSTDGQAFIWDVRKRDPLEQLTLETKDGSVAGVLGGVSLDYDSNVGGATRFMIGTEQGVILSCNRRVKNPADRITHAYGGHHGPVYAVQRNHGNFRYFLTIGDWTARIWSEEVTTGPIITTRYHTSYLTSGCWSPTRPGVFFTTKMDGTLDVWDYLYKQNAPVYSLQVADAGLHTLRVQNDGKLVAVGSRDGTMSLLELSNGLSDKQASEKDAISAMFEREQKRERNLIQSAKERQQKDRMRSNQDRHGDSKDPTLDSTELDSLTEEFYASIRVDHAASSSAGNAGEGTSGVNGVVSSASE